MTTERPTAPEAPRQRVPGDPSFWFFLVGDMAFFSLLFGVVLYYRGDHPEVFAAGQELLHQPYGLLNTIVLLTGSILVVRATQAVAARRLEVAQRLMGAAAASGVLFMAVKAAEYLSLLGDDATLHTDEFFMVFYAVTGAHLLHVVVATGALLWLRRRVRLGMPGARDGEYFESGACYWHMVDLLWLVLFPLFYLVN